MIRLRSLIAGLLGALAFAAGASAADMPGTWTPPPAMVPRYTELLSGWYLRLDANYGWNSIGSVQSATATTGAKLNAAPDATFGFGWKYQWLRFEMTLDYSLPTTMSASTAAATTQPQYTGKLSWMTALGNAYLDLGTWYGFTPYVGAGVGASRLHSSNYNDSTLALNPAGGNKADTSNFSWAYMAGVAFRVSPSWMVDVGYRRLDLGHMQNSMGTGLPTDLTTFKNISTQEVRLGVRFLFD